MINTTIQRHIIKFQDKSLTLRAHATLKERYNTIDNHQEIFNTSKSTIWIHIQFIAQNNPLNSSQIHRKLHSLPPIPRKDHYSILKSSLLQKLFKLLFYSPL